MSDLVIRPARSDDLPALNDLYNQYVRDTVVTFDVEPFSLEKRLGWFEQFGVSGPLRLQIAEAGGAFAGYAGTLQFRVKEAYRTSVETTIYIHPEFQRRGVGLRLYESLFEALKDEDVHRAYAGITMPNGPSVALHERAGFSHIGTYSEVGFKMGKFHDVGWYERALNGPADGTGNRAKSPG